MTQETRIAAFNALKHSGLLGKLQLELAHLILKSPGKTQAEYAAIYSFDVEKKEQRSITPRFAELVTMGVIAQGEVKVCEVTGRKVATFVPTYGEPKKLQKKAARSAIETEIADLRCANFKLTFDNARLARENSELREKLGEKNSEKNDSRQMEFFK